MTLKKLMKLVASKKKDKNCEKNSMIKQIRKIIIYFY